MKFVDANVFVYAFLEPKRHLTEREASLKQRSKEILRRVEKGERVLTSVIQVAEVCNIFESRAAAEQALGIAGSIMFSDHIEVAAVDRALYAAALELAKAHGVSINDGVAAAVMHQRGVKDIYSHDADFDKIPGVARVER